MSAHAPQQQGGIQYAPPSYENNGAAPINEKTPSATSPQPQYPQPTQQFPHQQQQVLEEQPIQPVQPQATQGGGYLNASPLNTLSEGATPVDCPFCGVRELTTVKKVNGTQTHVFALLFCCIACLGCLPYLAGWGADIEHRCGSCKGLLAVFHRGGGTEVRAHAKAPGA